MTATFLKNIFSIGVTIPSIVSLDIRYTYFKWADPPCQTKISVYRTILAVSRLQCSLQCVNDMESICNKAVWDTVNSICMLHSKTVDFGTSKMVEVAPHLQVVRRVLRGCNATGYEYDQSAKLCVKNYKIGFTWQEAKLFCAYDSGNLVSVNNEETRDFVYEVAECNWRTWIGLQDETWLNGDPFVNIFGPSTSIQYRDSKFPEDTEKGCGSLVMKPEEKYVIHNSCNIRIRHYFLCSKVLP